MKEDKTRLIVLYQKQVSEELSSILNYWTMYSQDIVNGGFFGRIKSDESIDKNAPRGIVLNARILWTFSAAYQKTKDKNQLALAKRAYEYITTFFFDKEFGGFFWTLDCSGNMLDGKKQVYAQAFVIYGLSEYFAASKNKNALKHAKDLYELVEKYSHDEMNGGYIEAFSRDWSDTDDLRLSSKDANAKKTMNTHLHIVEAYANLYKVIKDKKINQKIIEILFLFDRYFIDSRSYHLKLFFDENWLEIPGAISYGHDIEAAWLLAECAEITGDALWIKKMNHYAPLMAKASAEGLDADGGMWYEYDPQHSKLIKEKHWWPQAEAMVGYLYAWQLTRNEAFFDKSYMAWQFVKIYLKTIEYGEWFWGVDDKLHIMEGYDKIGLWKCPYHNARACMEVQRITSAALGKQ